MAEAAKVIRIELRAMGGGSSSSGTRKKKEKKQKFKKEKIPETDLLGLTKKQNLAGAGFITSVNQFLGQIVSIGESLSYNSEEKTNIMALDIGKKAVSTSVLAGGYALGGPIGAAVGLIVNKMLIDPAYSMGRINISRNLDETRATNRFYQTNFAGKGNYTFNYSLGSYTNEDLEKVRKGSFYKRGRYI